VSQLGALGTTRRTRGVENHGGIVTPAYNHVSPGLRAADQALEVAGLHENAFRAGRVRAGVRGIGELVPGEEQLRLGIAEVKRHLALLEKRIHRHHDGARPQHPVVDEGKVRDVRQHDTDAITRQNALALQNTGDTRARLIELRVGDLETLHPQRHRVAVSSGRVGH
jgi:hypothetical protein